MRSTTKDKKIFDATFLYLVCCALPLTLTLSSPSNQRSANVSAATVATNPPSYDEKPLSYRFRKAWRAVFFLALIPFFTSKLIGDSLGIPDDLVKFFSGVLVLIPLSTFIEVVTEDLIERLGQLVGGLLHAFFGNIAYFVLTASALITAANINTTTTEGADAQKEILTVIQSSIAGTVVIDLLFILGISILIGGLRNGRMQFSAEYSNQYAEMITVAIIALAIPSVAKQFSISIGFGDNGFKIDDFEASTLSNITAVILILAYIGYIAWTVFHFRDIPAKAENPEDLRAELSGDQIGPLAISAAADERARQSQQFAMETAQTIKRVEPASISAAAVPASSRVIADIVNERLQRQNNGNETKAEQEAKDRRRGIAFWELAILVAGAGGVVFISEQMAKVFENGGLTTQLHLNPFFVGFILLPVASNLVELSAAVSTAFHNRMETCLAVTAGSAIQVVLLVAPALILVSHLAGLTNFNLIFGLFILAIFGLIAYLFQLVTVDGETTWLEGLQFSSFFAVIVVIALLATP
jgi:Ca2+:H+ antiporter